MVVKVTFSLRRGGGFGLIDVDGGGLPLGDGLPDGHNAASTAIAVLLGSLGGCGGDGRLGVGNLSVDVWRVRGWVGLGRRLGVVGGVGRLLSRAGLGGGGGIGLGGIGRLGGLRLGSRADTPTGDRVVAGKLLQLTVDELFQGRGSGARLGVVVEATGDLGALVHTDRAGITGVDDLLQHALVPAGDEVAVAGVAGPVAVGKDEGLRAGVLSPPVLEQGSVPVDLVEDVRDVNPALGAVLLAVTSVGREGHVGLVVLEARFRVVAGGEVQVHAEGGGVAVALGEGEAHAGTLVVRVLDAGLGAVGSGGPARGVEVAARARPLEGVDLALGRVEVLGTVTVRRVSGGGISAEHLQADGEGHNLVVGGLEA